MSIRADELHRTAKIFIENGIAKTIEDAVAILETFVLQVDVGQGIASSPTRQAMLLTVVNTGRRAFLGGVRVRIAEDPQLTIGWSEGRVLSEAIEEWGGQLVHELDERYATLAIGSSAAIGVRTLWPTWNGWSGGVVTDPSLSLGEAQEFEPAGVMAGAMGVSECFQSLTGNPRAARRSFGVSLWRTELDWRSSRARGPRLSYMPDGYWLPGLGHLGQAFAWLIGLLPYEDRSKVSLLLQDYDLVVTANESTSLLAQKSNIDVRKTRVVSGRLEQLGFQTAIVERAFDRHTRRTGNEPMLALAGFDKPEPRRTLGGAAFDRVVDAGLGSGPKQYLEMLIQSFGPGASTAGWFARRPQETNVDELLETPAYGELAARLVAEGKERGDARCGVVEIAGVKIGASFVGTVAAALTLSEPLRLLNGGASYQAISFSLRSPERIEVARAEATAAPVFGYVKAA